ncbi:MAG: T9SS type A sorting domain-containing protein [Ignavibacteriaceae bacterium]
MKKYLLLVVVFLSLGLTAYAQVNVTFTVDMSVWQKNGYFNPSTDTVRVAGDFNSWSTTATDLKKGTGADTLKYSVQVSGVTAGAHSYKFIYINSKGAQWENDPNRSVTTSTSNVVLPTVYFNNISGKMNHVWFKVDMSLPIKNGKLNPATDTVAATGDFTGWGTSGTGYLVLTKGANDSVYSGLKDSLASGRTLNFKFIYKNSSGVNWEDDPNRTYLVPEQDSSAFSDYWNRTNPNIRSGSGKINFTLDMSVMTKIGIYNPSKDSVLISAGFNGWTTTDPKAFLAQNPINDSSYFITQTFTNEPFGDKPYKYVVKKTNPTGIDTIWKDGYERPIYWGGGNRETLFMGLASQDTMDYYDGVHPDWIVPAGTNLKVIFKVDMNPAMDATKQAIPFVPAQDTLYWLSEEPAFARSQGWNRPSDGHMKIMKLTAQGNGIYSGTLTVKDPAFNAFEYRYEWQKGSDGTWVSEPAGFDNFAYRVRYAGQDKASHFPVNPWLMPKDTWTNNAVKTDQEKDPYQSYKDLVGIKTINQSPVSYSLSQNYPNPFNPSTTIKFSIQKPGLVTLKIYNILGQEVMTLVNQEMNMGSYSYSFDASRLSSGVYFYNIKSGSFVQTKKMLLLK